MSKTKKTVLNAIVSALKTAFVAIIALVMGRYVLTYLGSDYNGINATSNQIVSIMTILEGDFSTASLTALFEPLNKKDYKTVNGILSYSNHSFKKIGLSMLLSSVVLLLVYVPTVKTQLDRSVLYVVFFISILSTIIKVGIGNKYYLLVRTEQKEYISTLFELLAIVIFRTLSIVVLIKTRNIIFFRMMFLAESISICLMMWLYVKKNYRNINYNEKEIVKVNGTKDLFISKIVSAVYSSATVMFLSSASGAVYTSIYDVYNSIILGVKQIVYVAVYAPMNAFGKLFVEKDRGQVYKIFVEYELLIMFIASVVITTVCVVSKPFVLLYTDGVNDINYNNAYIPILLCLIAITELLHIPSGICINMTRNFEDSRKIQSITCASLLVADLIGSSLFGFYGILLATLFVNVFLASLEISYTRKKIFQTDFKLFLKHLLTNLVVTVFSTFEFDICDKYINSYLSFFIVGFIMISINSFVAFLINYLANREYTVSLIQRFSGGLKKYFAKKA